jgi:hypothetical protein
VGTYDFGLPGGQPRAAQAPPVNIDGKATRTPTVHLERDTQCVQGLAQPEVVLKVASVNLCEATAPTVDRFNIVGKDL